MRESFRITVEPGALAEDREKVTHGLISYNLEFLEDKVEHLNLFLRDEAGEIAGGLLAHIYWGWLHIDDLWLDESIRRQRWGSKLLALAEAEALARGCHAVHLDTFDFQALPFYEGQGYEVFGELGPFPGGHTRYYLKKELAKGT